MSEKFTPSATVIERLGGLDIERRKPITDCLKVWDWCADITNTDEQPPLKSDDPAQRELSESFWRGAETVAFLPETCRIIPINALHKGNAGFRKQTKAALNQALDTLQALGVCTGQIFVPSLAGHSRECRYISGDWVANEDNFSQLESKLCDLLLEAIKPAAPPEVPNYLRALQDIRVYQNGSAINLKKGSIACGWHLCKYLLEIGAPVSPIESADIVACDNCRHMFAPESNSDTETPVLVILQDFRCWFNQSTVIRRRGEIESDPFLVSFMLSSGAPVALARQSEFATCPNCSKIFQRPQPLGDAVATRAFKESLNAPLAETPTPVNVASTYAPPVPPGTTDNLMQPLGELPLGKRLEKRFSEPDC